MLMSPIRVAEMIDVLLLLLLGMGLSMALSGWSLLL